MNKITRKEEEISHLNSRIAADSRTIQELQEGQSVAVSAAARSAKVSERTRLSSEKSIIRRKLNKALKNEKVRNITCEIFV